LSAATIANSKNLQSCLQSVFTNVLTEKPPYGSVAIELFFHNNELARVVTTKSESVMPKEVVS
jgi:hypothetical protein